MTDPTARPPLQPGPMPFRILLDEAMRRTRRHFRAIFPAVAIPLAVLAAATGILQALWFKDLTGEAMANPFMSFHTIVLALVQGLVAGIGVVALQKAAVDATAGRPVDMKEAWRFAVRPQVLGTFILQFLAVVVSALVCCVPFLFVAPLLSLTGVAMAEEKIFGLNALSRSAALTLYNPQRAFLDAPIVKAFVLIFLVLVLTYAVSILVTLPFQIPMLVSIFRDSATGKDPAQTLESMSKWLWIQIPGQVLQILTTMAVSLYSAFGSALLFFDIRGRKEGSDLAAEIHSVFGPAPGEPAP
jgi:hypothetical protein